jgi:hypothetical protein
MNSSLENQELLSLNAGQSDDDVQIYVSSFQIFFHLITTIRSFELRANLGVFVKLFAFLRKNLSHLYILIGACTITPPNIKLL